MSPATKKPASESKATDGKHQYVDFDEYVEFHLARTRSGIKYTEILTALGWIATLGLCYLLTFTVFDHWLIEGGISRSARLWLLVSATALTAGWIGWKVIVPYLRQINFLYAARQIEQSAPSLKGGLVNLVDLQNAGRKIPNHVRVAIEKRAALELSQVEVEQAVDRGPLLRVSYLLLFVVIVCCSYTLFSPKDILASVKRAILPASSTAAPTQTQITDVEPGDVSVVARSSVSVRANVSGSIDDEVTLFYSTGDGKYVDEPILMQREQEDLSTFTGLLAGENARGLLQDVTYRIQAGDAATRDYTITVVQPPSAQVESVSYQFPAYMELENRTEATGHINGWEGAAVTVRAVTNIPVKTAKIVFVDGDQPTGEEIRMKVNNGNQLSAEWPLEIRSDGTFAPHYWIECRTADDRTDPSPTRYNVLIKPDAPPEVAMLAPQRDLQMPANGMVPVRYRAKDPDFQLRSMKLIVAKDGDRIVEEPLAEEGEIGKSIQGRYKWKLEPLKLSVGDRLQFWLEAKDNRIPRANTKATHRLKIEIIEPVSEEEAEEQFQEEQEKQQQQQQQDQQQEEQTDESAEQDPNQQQPQEGEGEGEGDTQDEQQSEEGGEQGEATNQSETDQSESESEEGGNESGAEEGNSDEGAQSSSEEGGNNQQGEQSLDPESQEDQEKALEKILEHQRQQKEKQQAAEQEKQEDQDEQQPGEEKKPGEERQEKQEQGKQGESDEGDSSQQGDQKSDSADQSQEEQADEQKQEKNPSGEEQQGGGEEGDSQGGSGGKSQGGDQNNPGESNSGEKGESGDNPSGESSQGGDKPSDKQQPAPGEADPQESGDESGTEKPGAENPNAEQKDATGDEQGSGRASDDQDAKKANKPLNREGDKNEAGRKPGDSNQKPQAQEKGDPKDQPKGKEKPGENSEGDQQEEGKGKQGDPQEVKPEGKQGEEKTEPQDDDKAKPQGQPEGSGEEPKGEGEDDQKSQQPDEGEDGNSSQSEGGEEGSQESGSGEDAKQGGDPQAEAQDGKPGESPGEGSTSKPREQAGGKEEAQAGDETQEGGQAGGGANPPDQQGGEPAGGGDGDAADEGEPGAENKPPNDSKLEEEADEAKLEYSKKATNLVLDRLKEQLQRGEPDQELLEKLGWTEDQLRSFTDRMQNQIQDDGKDTSPAAVSQRRQFQEMLKDLHTKPAAKRRAGASKEQQRVKQLDTRKRTPIPRRFRSRYRQYTQSFQNRQKPKTGSKSTKKK